MSAGVAFADWVSADVAFAHTRTWRSDRVILLADSLNAEPDVCVQHGTGPQDSATAISANAV